jgi:hypothetical protein
VKIKTDVLPASANGDGPNMLVIIGAGAVIVLAVAGYFVYRSRSSKKDGDE